MSEHVKKANQRLLLTLLMAKHLKDNEPDEFINKFQKMRRMSFRTQDQDVDNPDRTRSIIGAGSGH